MDRRPLLPGLALAAGLVLAACSEQPQEQDLQQHTAVGSLFPDCNTNGFSSLINVFSGAQRERVRDYVDAMLEATTDLEAEENGFNILTEISAAAKVGEPSASTISTLSTLAVETLRCIVNVDDPLVIKDVNPNLDYFIEELDHAAGGGFEVRGGVEDPDSPAQAVKGGAVISGIAPPEPADPTWWDDSFGAVPNLTERVLFYGVPSGDESDPTPAYTWSVVPHDAEFAPPLVVTTCIDDATLDDPFSAMQTETGEGAFDFVLAFVPADYICELDEVVSSAGRFNLLGHLADLGRKLILPEPAAATVVMPGLVGGSAKGVKSEFDVDAVTNLDVSLDPTSVKTLVVKTGNFDLEVTVMEDGRLVNGATVVASTAINSGAFNFIHERQSDGTCSGGTPTKETGSGEFLTGTVTFHNLCITQTGYVNVFINVGFAERSGTGSATIPRIKVIPPPKK
jgi:hypothetical protein